MEIIKYLSKLSIIKKYEVIDFKAYKTGFYVKIEILFQNATKLFVKEYSDENKRNYSYHWLDKNNKLITRWDNSFFHENVITHPHHKHTPKGILPSYDITLIDVLKDIKNKIEKNE